MMEIKSKSDIDEIIKRKDDLYKKIYDKKTKKLQKQAYIAAIVFVYALIIGVISAVVEILFNGNSNLTSQLTMFDKIFLNIEVISIIVAIGSLIFEMIIYHKMSAKEETSLNKTYKKLKKDKIQFKGNQININDKIYIKSFNWYIDYEKETDVGLISIDKIQNNEIPYKCIPYLNYKYLNDDDELIEKRIEITPEMSTILNELEENDGYIEIVD